MTIIRTGARRGLKSGVTEPDDQVAHSVVPDRLLMLPRTTTPTAGHDYGDSPHPGLLPLGISQI